MAKCGGGAPRPKGKGEMAKCGGGEPTAKYAKYAKWKGKTAKGGGGEPTAKSSVIPRESDESRNLSASVTGNWKLARKRVGYPQITQMTQILVWDLGLVICDFPHPLRARESSLQSSPESSPESFVESLFKSSFESSLQSSVQSSFKSSSQSSVQSSVQSSRKSSVKSLVQSSFKSSLESSLGVRPKTPFEAAPRQTGDRVTLDFSSLAQQLRLRPSGFSAALLGGTTTVPSL